MGAFQGIFTRSISIQGGTRKKSGAAGYGSNNNVKHGKMKITFMNLGSTEEACDSAFTKLTTANGNMYTELRCQEDHIWELQAEICNIKVAHETRNNDVKGKKGRTYI